jgi:hypothetical protein
MIAVVVVAARIRAAEVVAVAAEAAAIMQVEVVAAVTIREAAMVATVVQVVAIMVVEAVVVIPVALVHHHLRQKKLHRHHKQPQNRHVLMVQNQILPLVIAPKLQHNKM